MTDADGQYAFRGLTGGTYTVAEVAWDYWEQTFPGGDGRHTVTVTPGQVVTDVDFANRRIPGIHGVKWYDLDEDGIRDPGEPGVADWTIYLDENNNGQLDWGEPSTLSSRNGRYAVTGIAGGTYTVAEMVPPGWEQTFPGGDGRHTVTLPADRAVADVDFGNRWLPSVGFGQNGDGVVDLIVAENGVIIDTDGVTINSYAIHSAAGIFTGEPADNLGAVQEDADYHISGVLGFTLNGTHLLGDVIGGELHGTDLFEDLTLNYSIDGTVGVWAGTLIPIFPGTGGIQGNVFNDRDADDVPDAGEPRLAGWTVYMDLDDDGQQDSDEPSARSNADGQYTFWGLRDGTYTVAEVLQDGWEQTCPGGDGRHTVTITSGEVVSDVDFGNRSGEIQGAKFNDRNADGVWDADEPGMAGWRIYLDLNHNGQRDGDEPSTLTGASGQYAFAGLLGGTYTVAEVLQDGWEQTFPGGDGRHTLTITFGELVGDVNFGNWSGEIHGAKWYDRNADGVWDADEPGIERWLIYLDVNNNGQRDEEEPRTSTDANGEYTFRGLVSGTYTITEHLQQGWEQTFPGGDGRHTVVLRPGEVLQDVDFGNWSGEIRGTKFEDRNADGIWDADEPGMADWRIYLDLNDNGQRDVDEPSTWTDADGEYALTGLVSGTYTVAEVFRDGWEQTFPGGDGRHTVVLRPGEVLQDVDFGNWSGEIRGAKFDDRNADGVWDPDEPGMAGWQIYVDMNNNGQRGANEPSTLTGTNGQYTLTGLSSGTYTVAEVLQDGWEQTFPGGNGRHTVTITRGQAVTDVDFGNCSGTIRGTIWKDLNADGTWDPSEPGLPEWTIFLDLDQDGRQDWNEPLALTDADGQYFFSSLTSGTYTVAEVTRPGWMQTFPGGEHRHTVTVGPGQLAVEVDFGNHQLPGVYGVKWLDRDHDGVRDARDRGLPDWTIYIDLNNNGQLDWGEASTLTDANGEYALTGLSSGTYSVAEISRDGWEQTFPGGDGRHTVTLTADQTVMGVDFGDLCGSAGHGVPGDGVVDLIITQEGVGIDSDGLVLTSYVLRSAAGIFTGEPANNLGAVVQDDDHIIGGIGCTLDGMHLLGNVIGDEFDDVDLSQDLTFEYAEQGWGETFGGDIVPPPPPLIGMELVAVASPTVSDEAATLPDSLTCVPSDSTFFVEIWLQDIGTPGVGIAGGYVDLNYTASRAEALALGHGDIFTELPSGRIDDATGLVDDFGGGTSSGGIGMDPNWARLGLLEFQATTADELTFSLSPGSVPLMHNGAGNVPWDRVTFADSPLIVSVLEPESEQVVGRYVFYNDSAFDGGDPAADARDDDAIAPDKEALLPGHTATFANYTSYSRGINGIMVDIANLPEGDGLDQDDFRFRVGNDGAADGWAIAPNPTSITVRRGEGANESDRITLIWPNSAIQKQWLQVTVLADADSGLIQDDVFYFGNAVGESGNSVTDAKVNAVDMFAARNNQRTFMDPAPVDFDFDFDRDGRVNATDVLIARNNQTHFLNALKLITVPGDHSAKEASARDSVFEHEAGWESGPESQQEPWTAKLAWLGEFEQPSTSKRASEKGGRSAFPVSLMFLVSHDRGS